MSKSPPNSPPSAPSTAPPTAEPRHLRWDFAPARWNLGVLIVHFEHELEGRMTCYAPPGASLYGETGLEVAGWRRGVWRHETHFFENREPDAIEALSAVVVRRELPADFHRWAADETAAHVERLRSFAHDRPRALDVAHTAARLLNDLDEAFPSALERYWKRTTAEARALEAASGALWQSASLSTPQLVTRELHTDRLRLGALRNWRDLAVNVLFMALLYLAYRALLRPPLAGAEFGVITQGSLEERIRDTLLWLYGVAHLPLIFGFLTWAYFRRHSAFVFVRNALLLAAGGAIAIYELAVLLSGGSVYDDGRMHTMPAETLPTLPGLHLATALVIGVSGVLLVDRRPMRIAWGAYPIIVMLIIVVDPPVWLWPTLSGAGLLSFAAWMLASAAGRIRNAWRPPPQLLVRVPRAQRELPDDASGVDENRLASAPA
jgi:hypothetical protein